VDDSAKQSYVEDVDGASPLVMSAQATEIDRVTPRVKTLQKPAARP